MWGEVWSEGSPLWNEGWDQSRFVAKEALLRRDLCTVGPHEERPHGDGIYIWVDIMLAL